MRRWFISAEGLTSDTLRVLVTHTSTKGWRMDCGRCVFNANGEIQAQQVRAFLDAAGISSELRGESLRNTHGLTLDGLGMVQIFVSEGDEARARALLASAEGGEFRLDDDAEVGSS
jgi:hypothetical protein